MQIGSNPIAQTAINAIHAANAAIAKSSERISTGLRINSAADDPAGMVLANWLKTQISSMSRAMDNVNQGIAMTQVVDESLTQMTNVLTDMSELANFDTSNTKYTDLMQSYLDTIDTISKNAVWNGTSLMYYSSTDTTTEYYDVTFQSGADQEDTITVRFDRIDTSTKGLSLQGTDTDFTLSANASAAAYAIEAAQEIVSDYQSQIGAMTNVLTYQYDALTNVSTAYSGAYGNTMNADLAQETANLAAAQIQRDGATAMLAQANGMNREIVSYLLKSVTSMAS